MLLKENLLQKILDQISFGVDALKKEHIEEADEFLRVASQMCLEIKLSDLNISQNHIDAVMKEKEYTNKEDALQYLLYLVRDFTLKGVVGNLLALCILCYVEELNVRKMQQSQKEIDDAVD